MDESHGTGVSEPSVSLQICSIWPTSGPPQMLFFSEPPSPAHHASSSCSSLWKHFFFCGSKLLRRFRRKKKKLFHFKQDIPDGSAGKESACDAEDIGGTSLVPGSGRSPEKGNGYPLQCSCLENSTGRGAWRPTAQSVGKSQIWLSTQTQRSRTLRLTPQATIQCLSSDKAGPPRTILSTNCWALTELKHCVSMWFNPRNTTLKQVLLSSL